MTREEMRALIEEATEQTGEERDKLVERLIDEAFASDAGGQLQQTLERVKMLEGERMDWENKYNTLNGRYTELRGLYRDRFMRAGRDRDDTQFVQTEVEEEVKAPKEYRYEDLFREVEDK